MLKELLPCITCLILGKVWCLLGFVPVIWEQQMWPDSLFQLSICIELTVSVTAWRCVLDQGAPTSTFCWGTLISAISYFMLGFVLFHGTESVSLLCSAVFILIFMSIITFTIVHITFNILWYFYKHGLRSFSFLAGLFFGVYDLGYGLTANNYDIEHTYLVSGVIWLFLLLCMIGLHYTRENAYNYEYEN